mgnify:CR=1 FL=1
MSINYEMLQVLGKAFAAEAMGLSPLEACQTVEYVGAAIGLPAGARHYNPLHDAPRQQRERKSEAPQGAKVCDEEAGKALQHCPKE